MKQNLDRTAFLCWGFLTLTVVLTLAILPPIGIIMWSVLGVGSLAVWGIGKLEERIENRKRGQ